MDIYFKGIHFYNLLLTYGYIYIILLYFFFFILVMLHKVLKFTLPNIHLPLFYVMFFYEYDFVTNMLAFNNYMCIYYAWDPRTYIVSIDNKSGQKELHNPFEISTESSNIVF